MVFVFVLAVALIVLLSHASFASPNTRQAPQPNASRDFNGPYADEHLNHVAFPLGGIGAGMICLEGTGALSHVSIRNRPEVFNEPQVFAAVCIKGQPNVARVLEGPVPKRKLFGRPGTGLGLECQTYGLPRFARATLAARFPFATVELADDNLPLAVSIVGWSPFEPGDTDNSSLPVGALEYTFTNTSRETVDAVFSFNAKNFFVSDRRADDVIPRGVRRTPNGFALWSNGHPDRPWEAVALAACLLDDGVCVDPAWFRGRNTDVLTMAWKRVVDGACEDRPEITDGAASPGGSVRTAITLKPGESRTVRLLLTWFAGASNTRQGRDPENVDTSCCGAEGHRPWYADRFENVQAVAAYGCERYDALRAAAQRFSDCFHDTTLPPEVVEAVAANLTILKSPTVLRQTDGRLWAWEGCCDGEGCCFGSCTHVWNYAQALPHLFPSLERTLRETEFMVSQDETGHQEFRTNLPIRPTLHNFYAAADGQLGGILKVHRDWRISGDTDWLRGLWPHVKASLDYCIRTWDPEREGALREPHHNTYDIEFWGPDGMCGSIYVGALDAFVRMGQTLNEDVVDYATLRDKARAFVESELFNGEYFIQKVDWRDRQFGDPRDAAVSIAKYDPPEAVELLQQEGPKYQYGVGCLSDGVIGAWFGRVCGIGDVLDPRKVASHLRAVHKHNLKHSLAEHANCVRPTFACGDEGGLVLCTWPNGGAMSLPFYFADEVWTGVEYQVASHLIMMGETEKGLEIIRATRSRYDGRVRNPFDEFECGHWYARAMASYALLQAFSGACYDAVDKTLHLAPTIAGDFRCFLSTATGYGTVGVRDGEPFIDVAHGVVDVQRIAYAPCASSASS